MKQISQNEWRRLLYLFTADNGFRPVLFNPFEEGDYVCATDANVLIRVAKKYIYGDFKTDKRTPDVSRVMPELNPKYIITDANLQDAFVRLGIDYNLMLIDCAECNSEGEVRWHYIDHDGDEHFMYAECPCCQGTKVVQNGSGKMCKIDSECFDARYILLLYHVISTLGIRHVDVTVDPRRQFLFHVAEGVDVVIMPLATEGLKRITYPCAKIKIARL